MSNEKASNRDNSHRKRTSKRIGTILNSMVPSFMTGVISLCVAKCKKQAVLGEAVGKRKNKDGTMMLNRKKIRSMVVSPVQIS